MKACTAELPMNHRGSWILSLEPEKWRFPASHAGYPQSSSSYKWDVTTKTIQLDIHHWALVTFWRCSQCFSREDLCQIGEYVQL